MSANTETGKKAEVLAREFLAGKGYKILTVNWRYCHKEIDIIAEYDNRLIVVEVKSTIESNYSNPSELLSNRKMRYIVDAAEAYIFEYDVHKEVRFDLIAVIFSRKGHKIEHIESAIIPGVNW